MPGIDPNLNVIPETELAKIAKEQLNEDPKRVKADLKALRDWIAKQPHLAKTAKTGEISYI